MTATPARKHFRYVKGELHCEGVALTRLVEKYGSPLYVYSEGDMREQVRRFTNGLRGIPHTLFYAVKANSNLTILKRLRALGTGVDLVSYGELYRAERAGFPHEKMVFSGVGKTRDELRRALRLPLHSINVESAAEFATIRSLLPRRVSETKRPRIAFRFNPDVDPKTHPYISTGLRENKFGLNRDEILEIIRDPSFRDQVNVTGLSVHIGSQIETLSPFADAIDRCLELVADLERLRGLRVTTLDLGGGIAIPYRGKEKISVEAYGRLIQRYFGPRGTHAGRFRLGFEPGRRIIGSAGALVTEVLFRKSRTEKEFLVLDAGMNDLMRPALYQSYHEIVPLRSDPPGVRRTATDLVGPVCESSDRFAQDRMMNRALGTGDRLAILDAGAYGMSMSSQYNTRPRAAEILVSGKTVTKIRARETLRDLLRGE